MKNRNYSQKIPFIQDCLIKNRGFLAKPCIISKICRKPRFLCKWLLVLPKQLQKKGTGKNEKRQRSADTKHDVDRKAPKKKDDKKGDDTKKR